MNSQTQYLVKVDQRTNERKRQNLVRVWAGLAGGF